MKRKLVLLLAALTTQGLFAGSQGYYGNDCCPQDCCNWNLCDSDFYVAVDWLYWKSHRCDLDIATFGGVDWIDAAILGTVVDQAKVVNIDHTYQSGVRVAAGMQWCSGWGFGLEYVYFNPSDSVSEESDTAISLSRIPLVADVFDPTSTNEIPTLTGAQATYEMELNQLDLLFSREFSCNPCRQVRSYFGVRLAWIDDHLRTAYTGTDAGSSGPVTIGLDERNKLNAYGLTVGGEVFQDLWCSLGLYMKAGFGVLYGSYDQTVRNYLETTGSTDATTIIGVNLRDSADCLVSNLDIAVGLGFEGCDFCCASWSVILGYEYHDWFNYRDYLSIFDSNAEVSAQLLHNKSDLAYSGLFLRLRVEF